MSSRTNSCVWKESDKDQYLANAYYDSDQQQEGEDPVVKRSLWRRALSLIRPDYFLDHLDYESLKVILPTFVQVWTTVILVVVTKTSNWFGTTSYLLQILGFVGAAGGQSVILNVIMAVASFTAMVVGWFFSVVALAIATSIRGWPTRSQIAEELIAEGTCTEENISDCITEVIFTGRYLDARCSVIFAISLIFAITLFGLASKVHKMARLVYVCASISGVINATYSAFYPYFNPTSIGLLIIKPSGVAFALKIIVGVLFFPFTSSWKYFSASSEILSSLTEMSKRNERFFSTMTPSQESFSNYQGLLADIQEIRLKFASIEVFLQSTRWEVSYGRFSSDDAYEFSSRMKALLNTFSGYEYFYSLMQERKELLQNVFYPRDRKGSLSAINSSGFSKVFAALGHRYREVGKMEDHRVQNLFSEQTPGMAFEGYTLKDLDVISQHIKETHASYLAVLTTAIGEACNWLAEANKFRCFSFLKRELHVQHQKQNSAAIKQARDNLKTFITEREEKQYNIMLGISRKLKGDEQTLTLLSQTSMLLFISKQAASQVISMLDFFISIDNSTPGPKFQWGFRKSKQQNEKATSGENVLTKEFRARDPDSLPPNNPLQVLIWVLSKFYAVLVKQDYIYWVQAAILVTLCVIPFYFRNSASWLYHYKIVWFPIMCAVSTTQGTAESVYMFVTKVVYTFIGAIAGLIAWYISTGSGDGNHYGYAAVTAVLYFFICFYRHFSMHSLPIAGIMICVTPTLVLGTSWVDFQFDASDLGVGWRVALARFVSVIAGLIVAFTLSFFPIVRSSKAAFRKSISCTYEQLNDLHSRVSRFAIQRYEDPDIHIRMAHDRLSDDIRSQLLELARIKGAMKRIKYEVPLTGVWPTEKYEKLHKLLVSITQLHFLLYRLLDQIENTDFWIPHIVNRAAWNSPEFMSQMVSSTYMASEALRLKIPLPEISTASLSIRHLEALSNMWGTKHISFNERLYGESESDEESELRHRAHDKLDFDSLLSHDGKLNMVALLLTHMIYKKFDQALLLTKGLVGEKYSFDPNMFKL